MKTLLKIAYSDENRFKKLWDSIFPILGLFFFFFFLSGENQTQRSILLQKKNQRLQKSQVIRGAIFSGKDSIQTWSSLPKTTSLARKWTTILSEFDIGEITTPKTSG